jgi:hypothetical protein
MFCFLDTKVVQEPWVAIKRVWNNLFYAVISLSVLMIFFAYSLNFISDNQRLKKLAERMLALEPASRAKAIAKELNAPSPEIRSQRDSDIAIIKAFANRKFEAGDKSFLVVRGPKGVGKSTVVATALEGLPCVKLQLIGPDTDSDVISDRVLEAIASGIIAPGERPSFAAKRVLASYRELFPNRPPILVVLPV